ncbi:hypothetical protein HPB49_021715 [Dermacentor silvarum]|uniref:Uncharacterized protein n=1 Tax=Dermacentor silvarum TaxID=543639 RepID=A0ACB8CN16_DERSI|nr:hypothetical protein HPB49_021715 [Dermacentor silvarum]
MDSEFSTRFRRVRCKPTKRRSRKPPQLPERKGCRTTEPQTPHAYPECCTGAQIEIRLPDEYDVAREMLTRHFAAPCNIHLQRHRFRERCQLQGEPITDFALTLRELAALSDFATQADENVCEQFVVVVTCPRLRERLLLEGDKLTFGHAFQIALLRERTQRGYEAFANPSHRRFSSHTHTASAPDLNAAAVSPGTGTATVCGNCGATSCLPSACPLAVAHALPADAAVTSGELVEAPPAHEKGTLPRSTKSYRKKMLQVSLAF